MADMLERIAKLLNQAENAGTEAEAAVFMERATQLATVHSIDLARARHATIAKQRTVPVQRSVHIGARGTRGLRTLTDLYLGIAAANDIRCTIAHDATVVYAVGFAEDLDVAEAMFASLQVQQAKALEVFKREGVWKSEKVWVQSADYGYGAWKPQTWLTARLNFQDSFASRIRSRLLEVKWAEESRQKELDAKRAAFPHIDWSTDELTEHFKQWFFDAHGLDLDEDDSTAQEFRDAFLSVPTADMIDGWAGELFLDYMVACAEQEQHRESTALVLVAKREAVKEAAADNERRARGSYRGGHSGARSASGSAGGRAAADRAKLGASTAIGGVKGAISA